MEVRIIEFAGILRRSGIRVSTAETLEALQGAHALGLRDRATFKNVLRAMMVKRTPDIESTGRTVPDPAKAQLSQQADSQGTIEHNPAPARGDSQLLAQSLRSITPTMGQRRARPVPLRRAARPRHQHHG